MPDMGDIKTYKQVIVLTVQWRGQKSKQIFRSTEELLTQEAVEGAYPLRVGKVSEKPIYKKRPNR